MVSGQELVLGLNLLLDRIGTLHCLNTKCLGHQLDRTMSILNSSKLRNNLNRCCYRRYYQNIYTLLELDLESVLAKDLAVDLHLVWELGCLKN